MSNKDRIGDMLLGEGDKSDDCREEWGSDEYQRMLAAPTATAKALTEARAEIARLKEEAHAKWHDLNDRWAELCAADNLKHAAERHGLNTQLTAAESKIAALKVDLAGMMKERDAAKSVCSMFDVWALEAVKKLRDMVPWENEVPGLSDLADDAWSALAAIYDGLEFKILRIERGQRERAEKTEAERDAALADLSQARAECERLKDIAHRASVRSSAVYSQALESKLARALAALRNARAWINGTDEQERGWAKRDRAEADAILADPESTAAVEAYEREREERAELEAQLAKVRRDCGTMIAVHDEVEGERDELRAQLGRTIAMLRQIRPCVVEAAANQRLATTVLVGLDAVLVNSADAQACQEEQEVIRLTLVQRHFDCPHYEPPCDCGKRASEIDEKLEVAIAKVDARRAGGKDDAK